MTVLATQGYLPSIVFGSPEGSDAFIVTQEHAGHEIVYVGEGAEATIWLDDILRDYWFIVTNEGGVLVEGDPLPRSALSLRPLHAGVTLEGERPLMHNGDSMFIQSL